ncbi:Clp protease N-terminal domain-containing protein [Streptomyces luteolifulvus]|uniref:Clp protease N-terminal domain-containing protein n=1 Tax=Streptomyces luteolifulvus TaxID=2615112 RepID=UPI0017858017|nr:Clp protease N-terminal domain-containing protein [Streptomyces luteolifulvus]
MIGERLGVTRQADRQRHADRVIDPRQRSGSRSGCRAGRPEADGLAEAGTEQLLLGLLTDGVAAAPLEQLGVSRDKILAQSADASSPLT